MIDNETIHKAFVRTKQILTENKDKKICCSVSGADSDIMLDICERFSPHQVHYIWFDTGIEYQATKDHLVYLEQKYDIQIERVRAKLPVPLGNKKHGSPFISKQVSEYIDRLQKHHFKFEDKPFEELLAEYPNCKGALLWWCNNFGENSHFNINRNVWLKEFLIKNPPSFPISQKCCEGAKKKPSIAYMREHNIDIMIIGVRKAEGGERATAYKNDFGYSHGLLQFRPILYFTDADKAEYEQRFNITHSKCYTEYGLKRTGCAGCPFGRDCEKEFEIVEKYEPKLYKAISNVFAESREYTHKYNEFKKLMTLKHSSNKKCHCCGTQIQGEDLVAMNLKFYGRDTKT